MSTKKLIIVAGMHRSGTSAMTGAIEQIGVKLGDNLAGPQAGINDKGYKEDLNVIALHEEMLWSIPAAWDDIIPFQIRQIEAINKYKQKLADILRDYFKASDLCAVKDPRICLFIPFWIEVCREQGIEILFILPSRDPAAVAKSLHKREAMQIDRALMLWRRYMLAAERSTREQQRIFVSYETFIQHSDPVMMQIIERVGRSYFGALDGLLAKARDFVTPSLNRSAQAQLGACDPLLFERCSEIHARFSDQIGRDLANTDTEFFDNVYAEYMRYVETIDVVLLDQIKGYAMHAQEYRNYWNDFRYSRASRAVALGKKYFRL